MDVGDIVLEEHGVDIINSFLSDPDIQEKLDLVSIHLNDVSKGNWIGVNQLRKKSKIKDISELTNFLDLLVMSKRAFSKKTDGVLFYKITLNKQQRIKVLKSAIKEFTDAIEAYKKELNELTS